MSRSHAHRILVVTAVEMEREAVLRGLGLEHQFSDEDSAGRDRILVRAGGVGMAAAAAATARTLTAAELSGEPFGLVISAGVAGGFAGRADVGATVLASRSVAADLGAEAPNGFLSLDALGFGSSIVETEPKVLATLEEALPDVIVGEVLTVSTVTGTVERAAALLARRPEAVAEAMEGFGVASAASQAGVAFAEVRTISNPVGPRDRALWRIPEALAALTGSARAMASLEP